MQPHIVLGLGTGQSGFTELHGVLSRQLQSSVTIEERPLLHWYAKDVESRISERIQRWFRQRDGFRLIADIAAFYLPYAAAAIRKFPSIKCICAQSPREQVVQRFCRQLDRSTPVPTNHWSQILEEPWQADPIWTHTFPKYNVIRREEAIAMYWDEYHRRAEELQAAFPDNFRVCDATALETEAGVESLLDFIGIQESMRVRVIAPASEEPATDEILATSHSQRYSDPFDPRRCVVLVPFGLFIHQDCDSGLKELERRGYPVRRIAGYAAIDQGRNQMATDALAEGFEETLWIDSDVCFHPDDVERIRRHRLPISCGIYPQKGKRALASHVGIGMDRITFGEEGGLVDILYAGAGFLHIRREVYLAVQRNLEHPVCNERFQSPMIPFFQPMIRPIDDGYWYLAEDYAFCERVRRAGIQLKADTSIRLWHIGNYRYGWEDAGMERTRFASFTMGFKDSDVVRSRTSTSDEDALRNLASLFPWPETRPVVEVQSDRNWLPALVRKALGDSVKTDFQVILEIGVGAGNTTRFLADLAPSATILAIDRWKVKAMDEELLSAEQIEAKRRFFSECWDYRSRIISVQSQPSQGLQQAADLGLVPQMVYIDPSTLPSEEISITIRTSLNLFPQALLLGLGHEDERILSTLRDLQESMHFRLEAMGPVWRIVRHQP